jgi:hypothetical protein
VGVGERERGGDRRARQSWKSVLLGGARGGGRQRVREEGALAVPHCMYVVFRVKKSRGELMAEDVLADAYDVDDDVSAGRSW